MTFSQHPQHDPKPPAHSLKLKWEPEVYLVSRPELDYDGASLFLDSVNAYEWASDADSAADEIPEIAGRLCYLSYKNPRPGGNKAYLEHILEVGHGSVLEHTNFGFIFAGVSRSLTHELVRHRAGMAYSQLSQRYVDESDCAFVVPYELQREVELYLDHLQKQQLSWIDQLWGSSFPDPDLIPGSSWYGSCQYALRSYQALVTHLLGKLAHIADKTERRKSARQTARSVLPNCTETMLFVTGNARAWRHFLEMRGSRHAEVEIRRLAYMVLMKLKEEAPNLFGDYRLEPLPDGTSEILTDHRKV